MMVLRKIRRHRQNLKESFDARLQMDQDARIQVAARLKAVELTLKNQGRIR